MKAGTTIIKVSLLIQDNNDEDVELVSIDINVEISEIVLIFPVLSAFSDEFIKHFKYGENTIEISDTNAIANIQNIFTYIIDNSNVDEVSNKDLATAYGKIIAEYIIDDSSTLSVLYYMITGSSNETFSSNLEHYKDYFGTLMTTLENINSNESKIVEQVEKLTEKFDTEYEIAEYFYNGASYTYTAANNDLNNSTIDTGNLKNAEENYKNAFKLVIDYVESYGLTDKNGSSSNWWDLEAGNFCGSTNVATCKDVAESSFQNISSITSIYDSSIEDYLMDLTIATGITYLYLLKYLVYIDYPDDTSDIIPKNNFLLTLRGGFYPIWHYYSYYAEGGNNKNKWYPTISSYFNDAKSGFDALSSENTQNNIKKNTYYLMASLLAYIEQDSFLGTLYDKIYIDNVAIETTEFAKDDYLGLFAD